MFQKIPRNIPENLGNVKEDSGNAIKDSEECYQRFWGMFKKIQGNVRKDSGECFQYQINQNHILLKKANAK